MEVHIRKPIDSIGHIFAGGDTLPFCGRDAIAGCEREVAEAISDVSDELKNEGLTRLSWALVHSRYSEDVQPGIAMLEDGLIGMGITATAVGLRVGGIAAAFARKN
ncbi:Fis1, N-terminal tetratricopeptide repeat [Dillenia turbinata]|uniref:Fis1, N-terminal tetratricopeptide repeat n=1 Tax=Dillenia turbinata TaxID=194707 RepID=A0AAN8W1T4_9MAGN